MRWCGVLWRVWCVWCVCKPPSLRVIRSDVLRLVLFYKRVVVRSDQGGRPTRTAGLGLSVEKFVDTVYSVSGASGALDNTGL